MNPLVAGRKLSLLLAVIVFGVSISLGYDCGQAAQIEFGYEYPHVTLPQWTPDGNQVILSRNGDITVVSVDGSQSSWDIHEIRDRLNDRSVRYDANHAPNVSPDGAEVAYMRRYSRDAITTDLQYEIHVVALDGSNIRRLTENDSHEASPVWSPDGRRIAYWTDSPEGSDWALMTMDGDGMDKRQIVTVEFVDPPPVRWSPDGRHLAFVRFHHEYATPTSEGVWEHAIYVVGADGSSPTRLAPTSSPPLWSHDGNRVFFINTQEVEDTNDVSMVLYSIRTDGTDLRIVADIGMRWRPKTFPYPVELNWSADGSEIWFKYGSSLTSIKADGMSISSLTAAYDFGEMAYSPNGRRVAAQVGSPRRLQPEHGNVTLFVMDADGTNQRILLRATADGLVSPQGDDSQHLIDWELTQYTPSEERSEETEAKSGLTLAACIDMGESCQSRSVTQTVWPPRIGGGAPPPSF